MLTIIKSKKFVLRPFKKGDEKSHQKNINDLNVYRYTLRIPHPYKIKDSKKWIIKNINSLKKEKPEMINFAIDINGEVVGSVGFDPIQGHKAEIGYWLGKKYWNKGITTEAIRLATNFGFKKLKLRRITAHVFSKNKSSARVLEKNGYKLEGLLRKEAIKNRMYIDALLYAKVK